MILASHFVFSAPKLLQDVAQRLTVQSVDQRHRRLQANNSPQEYFQHLSALVLNYRWKITYSEGPFTCHNMYFWFTSQRLTSQRHLKNHQTGESQWNNDYRRLSCEVTYMLCLCQPLKGAKIHPVSLRTSGTAHTT